MQAFVLDASVAFSWCFPYDPSENTPYSRAVLRSLERTDAVVPEIWSFEIANSIFVAFSKRKRIDEAQIAEYISLLKSLPIRVERRDFMAHVALEAVAREHDVSVYDAAYLDLAQRNQWPLATSDKHLRQASAAAGIEIVEP